MRRIKRWWWTAPVLLLLVLGGAVVWVQAAPSPMPEALAALLPGEGIDISEEDWLIFRPAGADPTVGFIFYPGGRVDPRSYAPAARAIASEGFLVAIVPMPLNLAVLGAGRGADVVASFDEIERWAVGGHSLGGAMAAKFAYDSPDLVDGLVLWAAYPAGGNDLSGYDLLAASIYGTLDGLASEAEVVSTGQLWPDGTEWVAIEGGNHSQFGWYGSQRGDNPATISRESQQERVVTATVRVLSGLQ